jgi:Lrp/AsnC family transcriptional regulator, leucine-responsive regulatory protein
MANIDLKDRRILHELDRNSRQSYSQIGKKVGLHKNVVNYRVKRMQEKGIISDFYTVIDTFKLGYNSLRFYITYQNITPSIRDEIINHFVENKYTWWVGSFEGDYDLAVVVWIKDIHDFFSFWETTLNKYQKYFKKQMFSLYCQLRLFRHTFLLESECKKSDREKFEITGGGKKVKTDEIDFKILSLISKDSRHPTVKIAETIGVSVDTVIQRMKNLEKMDVIQGYRVNIDYEKLGYHLFKVNINLNNYSDRGKIINYIKYNSHLIMIDKAIGYYDLELDFLLTDLDHLRSIMDDLSEKFPQSINSYNFVHDPIKHKMVYLPRE